MAPPHHTCPYYITLTHGFQRLRVLGKCISNPVTYGQWINLIKQGHYPRKIKLLHSNLLRYVITMQALQKAYSTTICKLVDLIPALHQSDCRIPNWVSTKTVHSSSINHGQTTARFQHSSGKGQGHVTKTKTHRFEISVAFRFTNV